MKIENSNLHITIKTNLDKKHKINNFGSIRKSGGGGGGPNNNRVKNKRKK